MFFRRFYFGVHRVRLWLRRSVGKTPKTSRAGQIIFSMTPEMIPESPSGTLRLAELPSTKRQYTMRVAELDPAILGAEYIAEEDILRALGISRRKLFELRRAGLGPPATVVGRDVYFRKASFAAWLESHERQERRRVRKPTRKPAKSESAE